MDDVKSTVAGIVTIILAIVHAAQAGWSFSAETVASLSAGVGLILASDSKKSA